MTRTAFCLILPVLLSAGVPLAQTAELQLAITEPAGGAVVPRQLTVAGTSTGISGQRILVFVFAPTADRWFFQGEATVGADGAWQVDPVIVSGGTFGSAAAPDATAAGVRIVAIAMDTIPAGLSGVPSADFPPAGTQTQSPIVVVTRGE